jgi:hypothetical protein
VKHVARLSAKTELLRDKRSQRQGIDVVPRMSLILGRTRCACPARVSAIATDYRL